jgi:N-acetylmuramoyl-L-alanine amidase CwlA
MVNVNIITKLLTINPYSRPSTKLNSVKGIVVHWTASPMGRNVGVWNYFERRKSGTNGYGSAHFIVDLDGAIWNCIPTNEVAYHVGSSTYTSEATSQLSSYPNNCTIGIEFCIVDNRGKMNDATWKEGAKLVAHLLEKFNLGIENIWTHQEVVGWKDCHRYFVENPNEYTRFKNDVNNYLTGKTSQPSDTNNSTAIGEFYTVKAGDTIWGIAQDNGTTVAKILEMNPNINPQILQIGEKIRIRLSETTQYQIIKGDTLWGIARKFETTVQNLKDLNPDINVYALQIGDFINVPQSSQPIPVTSNEDEILPNRVLKFGDTGEDVKKLQNALNKLYFKVGFADGIFGNATKDALMRFQSMFFGLAVDGIFGSETREKMLEQLLK